MVSNLTSNLKVLFFHSNGPDYLASGLFHGLRSILGRDCVDMPRFDCMYSPLVPGLKDKIRGNGFSLYGLLPDILDLTEERFLIWHEGLMNFDYFIVADIWNSWETYLKLRQRVPLEKIVIIDGADQSRLFPFANWAGDFKVNLINLLFGFNRRIKYFKREIPFSSQEFLGVGKIIPDVFIRKFIPLQLIPISFSIPKEKITLVDFRNKDQVFPSNVVDEEVSIMGGNKAVFTPLGKKVYKFHREDEYYHDIQRSKYGVTTRRSGWDCLRHYEYAANGAVLCFKNAHLKPTNCAPHGLNETNSIFYNNYQDLMAKISAVTEERYRELLSNTYSWIESKTTVAVAHNFLQQLQQLSK